MIGTDDTEPLKDGAALPTVIDDLSLSPHDLNQTLSVVDLATETPAERLARFELEAVPLMSGLLAHARKRANGDEYLAFDLVQMTYEKAYRHFAQYRPGTNLRAWLHRILDNTHNNIYRSQRRQPAAISVDGLMADQESDAALALLGDFPSAEQMALESLPDDDIETALAALSDDFRKVVVLADGQGYAYKEIAEMLDIPLGTVMSRLSRARNKLRESLRDAAFERGYLDAASAQVSQP